MKKRAKKKRAKKAATKSKTVVSKKKPKTRRTKSIPNLPFSYGKTLVHVLVRDPEWGYCYWDFAPQTWKAIQEHFSIDHGMQAKLRIHRVNFDTYIDMDVHLEAQSWYIHFASPNTTFRVELGLLTSTGNFLSLAKSNVVKTPRNAPSEVIDPNWVPESFEILYGMSGGQAPASHDLVTSS